MRVLQSGLKNNDDSISREVTAIREKFVGLKTLGIEGQGHEHGSHIF